MKHIRIKALALALRTAAARLSVHVIPWRAVGVGAAVLVLAEVWSRGVALEYDVKDLV